MEELRGEYTEVEKYRNYIATMKEKCSKDGVTIEYKESFNFAESLNKVLQQAQKVYENLSNPSLSIDIAFCVIEEVVKVKNQVEDLDGIVVETVNKALKLIKKISSEAKDIEKSKRETLFRRILNEIGNPIYVNKEEWVIEIINCCTYFVDELDFRRELKSKIITLIYSFDDSKHKNNIKEELLLILYKAISPYESNDKIDEFIYINITYPSFREIAIKRAIEAKNYNLALRIADEGQKLDEKRPSLLENWKKMKYLVYRDLGDIEKQKEVAMDLILGGNFEYYEKFKKLHSTEEWNEAYVTIKEKLSTSKLWRANKLYLEIVIAEDDERELINYIRRNPKEIEKYGELLLTNNKEEVKELYKKHILLYADASKNSRDYTELCKIIRKYKLIFGDEYKSVVDRLMNLYSLKPDLVAAISTI